MKIELTTKLKPVLALGRRKILDGHGHAPYKNAVISSRGIKKSVDKVIKSSDSRTRLNVVGLI